ncbi:hypothetical protein [Methylobacterium sp. AMS5]|uniref:hypothetical protein n=1 Tax=Methylobacterium sp. AMS5 TaxID=925818 RepID=UPI000AA15A64|nr:hypothetical protein [Methylobacterium sp. AMS5]
MAHSRGMVVRSKHRPGYLIQDDAFFPKAGNHLSGRCSIASDMPMNELDETISPDDPGAGRTERMILLRSAG